jgi:hypothetical protein
MSEVFNKFWRGLYKAKDNVGGDIQWITVHGRHIPIKAGQSRKDAIAQAFHQSGHGKPAGDDGEPSKQQIHELSKKALELTKKNGGVTISLHGDIPTKGWVVATSKETEKRLPLKKAHTKDLETYIKANADALKEDRRYFGAWVEKGDLFMDIPVVVKDQKEAEEIGRKADQIGIFNLETFETVRLKAEKAEGGRSLLFLIPTTGKTSEEIMQEAIKHLKDKEFIDSDGNFNDFSKEQTDEPSERRSVASDSSEWGRNVVERRTPFRH